MESFAYEEAFKLRELKALRLLLDKTIFAQLISELAEVIHLELVEKEEDLVFVFENTRFFQVRKHKNWQCDCGYLQKCCLPCRHLLKLLIFKKQSIIEHLPERWKIREKTVDQKQAEKPLGRERSSRRKIY